MWGDLKNIYIWFLIYIVASYGLLGAYDDYKKIKLKNAQVLFNPSALIKPMYIAITTDPTIKEPKNLVIIAAPSPMPY